MKKIIATACLIACSYGYSQSIKLFSVDENRWLNQIDTVKIEISPTTFSEDFYLDIANVSNNTINLVVKREIISLVKDAENLFCFVEQCFGPEYNGPTSPYSFSAEDTLFSEFHTTYYPNEQGGISVIKYTFYDNGNQADATSVIFIFNSGPVGIKEITKTASFNVYPNPTTGQLRIEMQHAESNKQQAEIYDIYGKKLSAFCLLPSATEIDISHLSAGIYFLKIDGKVVKMVKE